MTFVITYDFCSWIITYSDGTIRCVPVMSEILVDDANFIIIGGHSHLYSDCTSPLATDAADLFTQMRSLITPLPVQL